MEKRLIDLVSDTVTQPTLNMLKAMQNAKTGDDVYGEDDTANLLELKAAKILGKESSCFLPSGTMANLTAILAHCPRGFEVLVGDESDIYNYEAGGASVLGGVVYHPIPTEKNGCLSLENLSRAIRDENDYQFARAKLICLENPHNLRGGRILPLKYLETVYDFAKKHALKVHMDGARIFNASVALGIDPAKIARFADSVQFCLSKSLAAPVGSMLVGDTHFINDVRRLRKMLGGGMRQVGYLAAAGLVSLEEMIHRLPEDHLRAQKLAQGLSKIYGIKCSPLEVETNMVFFELADSNASIDQFLARLKEKSIRMSCLGYRRIRAAIHYHITDEDIDITLQTVRNLMTK